MESSIQIIWTFLKLSVFLARLLAVIGKTVPIYVSTIQLV